MKAFAATLITAIFFVSACAGSSPAANQPADTARAGAASASPAASATPSGPKLELLGKFALSPEHGPWGTKVNATATGLKANTKYDVVWTTVDGSWQLSDDKTEYKGRVYKPVYKPLAALTTGADGGFATTFTVPSEFGFQHDVLVMNADGVANNKSGFDVDLQVSISPATGPVGTPITIEAKGIGWRQLENSWLLSYDNNFTGWLSAVTTKGYAKAVIPATGAPGIHEVTVMHGDFTFPYLNTQQSPEPDRPMFHIPFTVTDGQAVLPASVTTQSLKARAGTAVTSGAGAWFDPASGVVGSQATIHGSGLPANADIQVAWSSVTGNRVSGTGWEEKTKTIASGKSDASGVFTASYTVPDDLGGLHNVAVMSGDKALAKTTFEILASAQPLAIDRGPSGTKVTIQLNGVGWTETANIFNLTYDNSYSGYACGFNSGGNVQIEYVMSGAPGWHFIDLYPGIYKGVETRPLNFRVPQLTYADDHPGEKLPAFHYAFLITP